MRFMPVAWEPDTPMWAKIVVWLAIGALLAIALVAAAVAFVFFAHLPSFF